MRILLVLLLLAGCRSQTTQPPPTTYVQPQRPAPMIFFDEPIYQPPVVRGQTYIYRGNGSVRYQTYPVWE